MKQTAAILMAALLLFSCGAAEESGSAGADEQQPLLLQITADDPSIAYVLVNAPEPVGLLPLPVEGEYERTIRQQMPDGSEAVNKIQLTPEGFRVTEANCENHDCIDEGEVTLANREERILGGMVICLPHRLMLELLTREEAEQLLGR